MKVLAKTFLELFDDCMTYSVTEAVQSNHLKLFPEPPVQDQGLDEVHLVKIFKESWIWNLWMKSSLERS
jgi:hypothetical protein